MRSQDAAKARAAEEARADALAQLKHFAFAWMNNCQDLHDFTVNLQDYLNKSLYEAHEREVSMIETAQQQGGHLMRLASAPMGSPRKSRVDFEETATQFLRSGTHFSSSVTAMLWRREVAPLCAPTDNNTTGLATDTMATAQDLGEDGSRAASPDPATFNARA